MLYRQCTLFSLTLDDRIGVRDVSALSSVHTLTLDDMIGVRDVSALSSVHYLLSYS